VRIGRYGTFLSCGDKKAPVPDETAPDELTLALALELLKKGAEGPRTLGNDPETGLPVYVRVGRFGPYFQLGEAMEAGKKKAEKPKMASLLAGMTPETVTLDEALATLSLPRTVGVAKTAEGQDEPILAANGRYGPYLKWGKETRSIPAGHTPLSIDLKLAQELLAQPKTGRGGRGAPGQQKARRELGDSPVTGKVVKLLDGRYGPYVTDGTSNASLGKDENPDELTLVRALELLAGAAPSREGPRRRLRKKKNNLSITGGTGGSHLARGRAHRAFGNALGSGKSARSREEATLHRLLLERLSLRPAAAERFRSDAEPRSPPCLGELRDLLRFRRRKSRRRQRDGQLERRRRRPAGRHFGHHRVHTRRRGLPDHVGIATRREQGRDQIPVCPRVRRQHEGLRSPEGLGRRRPVEPARVVQVVVGDELVHETECRCVGPLAPLPHELQALHGVPGGSDPRRPHRRFQRSPARERRVLGSHPPAQGLGPYRSTTGRTGGPEESCSPDPSREGQAIHHAPNHPGSDLRRNRSASRTSGQFLP
jgi:topoisomerase IA-like protein